MFLIVELFFILPKRENKENRGSTQSAEQLNLEPTIALNTSVIACLPSYSYFNIDLAKSSFKRRIFSTTAQT